MIHEYMDWKEMPSGRYAKTVDTKHGLACLHAWPDGRWEVTRSGNQIASGCEWTRDLGDAKACAENWLYNQMQREHERTTS